MLGYQANKKKLAEFHGATIKKGEYLHDFDAKNPAKREKMIHDTTKKKDDRDERVGTPNPWYEHQKRKLILKYQKQLL